MQKGTIFKQFGYEHLKQRDHPEKNSKVEILNNDMVII
jgi:hypothetical protein